MTRFTSIFLLKLRKKLEKVRSKEHIEELQNPVVNDIIYSIRRNEAVGNISHTDALDLIELTTKLYMKIYSKYKELEGFTMRLCDQSLELISDKYEKTVEELEDENNELTEEVNELKGEVKEMKEIIKDLERQLKEAQKKE